MEKSICMEAIHFSSIYNSPKWGSLACPLGEACLSKLKTFPWWSVTQQFNDDL